jgi:glycosyltransferase involved in cell wall biosynthesis
MVQYHRRRRTWREKVDRFIVMTEFARQKFAAADWEARRFVVKPHSCPPAAAPPDFSERRGAFFAGRLSPEKGVATLLNAWEGFAYPLSLAGDGPLRNEVERCGNPSVRLLGWLSSQEMSAQLRQASFLVVPSEWYETFGLVIIEAFAHGLPVIASRLGAMAELVKDGVTGVHFEAGNPDDLGSKVRWLLEHPEECRRMGENARRESEEKYTPERNYQLLMNIYREVVDEKKKSHQRRH